MSTTSVPARLRRRATVTIVLLTLAGLPACDPDPPDDAATTSSPSTPTTPSERANTGPASVLDYTRQLGLVVDTDVDGRCADVYSMPNEAILYVGTDARRRRTIEELWSGVVEAFAALNEKPGIVDDSVNQLTTEPGSGNYVESPAEPVFRIALTDSLVVADLPIVNRALAPILGDDVVLDLNYVGPYLPAPTFHPASDPVPAAGIGDATAEREAQRGNHRVLVVDSPDRVPPDEWTEAWTGQATDNQTDGMVDFVTGHGAFVVDLIERLAPGASVELSGVQHDGAANVPLPGFLFTELDVVRALEHGLGARDDGTQSGDPDFLPLREYTVAPFDVVNFSLGTVGCPDATHDVLARALTDVLTLPYAGGDGEGERSPGAGTVFVAAAGNDGLELRASGEAGHAHYPAGYSDLPAPLGDQVVGVGALAEDNSVADYSNPCVVDVWAPGTATAAFPWLGAASPGLATWAGTSFATAYVSAALADDPDPVAATWADTRTATAFAAEPTFVVEPVTLGC